LGPCPQLDIKEPEMQVALDVGQHIAGTAFECERDRSARDKENVLGSAGRDADRELRIKGNVDVEIDIEADSQGGSLLAKVDRERLIVDLGMQIDVEEQFERTGG